MEASPRRPFDCNVEIPGWHLHVAHLLLFEDRDLGNVMDVALRGASNHLRRCFPEGELFDNRTVRSLHETLSRMGLDPDRIPPCSESLLNCFLDNRKAMRGPLAWEFLALLTIKSQAPWSVVDRMTINPPLVFRYGRPGESFATSAGAMDCENLPVLADDGGIRATPWTHGAPDELVVCSEPLFICYLPEELFRTVQPKSHIGRTVWMTWAYRFVFEKTYTYRSATP